MTFHELGLSQPILDAIGERGFTEPTTIQAEMIPFLLSEDRDVTGLAQTGTGKTAAFGLPILEKLDPDDHRIQALIICPTRELCIQVSKEIDDYGRKIKHLKTAVVYGGAAFGPQIRDLKSGAQVVTATPGRLKDLLDKGIANLSGLRRLVLDEADQMLDMGFKDELDAILEAAPSTRQTLLFSATMPPMVARIAKNYMVNPHEIVAGDRNRGIATVDHKYYRVHATDKYATLRRLIDVHPDMYGIVFCRTRLATVDIAARLAKDGYAADALHGDLSQIQRESVMRRFREGNPRILVATDVAARGLDVDDLTHVIHYDLPDEADVYNHRSGRTGRAGRSGTSLALAHLREGHRIHRIEQVLGRRIEESRIPGGSEICEKRLLHLVDRVTSVEVDDKGILPYMDAVNEKLAGLDRDELIRRFVSVEFNRFLEEYGDARDLNPPMRQKSPRGGFERASGRPGDSRNDGGAGSMVWLKINLGRHDGVLPPQIIGLVNQASKTRNIRLGKIDINPDDSQFQVDSGKAELLEKTLNGYDYRGKKVFISPGSGSDSGRGGSGRGGAGRSSGYRRSGGRSNAYGGRSRSGNKFGFDKSSSPRRKKKSQN